MKNETPPNDVWYYAKDGSSIGPFTQAELLQKAAEGTITPETFVIKPGESEWVPFASVDAFRTARHAREPAMQTLEVTHREKSVAPSAFKNANETGDLQRVLSKKEIAGGLIFAFCLLLAFCFWELRGAKNENSANADGAEQGANIRSKQKDKLPYPFTVKEARDYYQMAFKARTGMEGLFESVISKEEAERAQMDISSIRDKSGKAQALLWDIKFLFGHNDRLGNVGTFRSELVESLNALNLALTFLEELRKARTVEAERASIRLFNVSLEHCVSALNRAEGLLVAAEEGLAAPL